MLAKIENENLVYIYESIPVDIVLAASATMPEYKTVDAAGMDLVASKDTILTAFKPEAVPTGIKIALPSGYEGQIRPRSGLSLQGVTVYNAPGTIDFGFTGEVKVILMYISSDPTQKTYEIRKGDRIAQLVLSKCHRAKLNPVLFLAETERGESGFGSTGR
jgi:dUTP pyrophosphatase